MRQHPEAELNAILIDFFLYDAMKEMEEKYSKESQNASAEEEEEVEEYVPRRRRKPVLETNEETREIVPHHRTRSIWY